VADARATFGGGIAVITGAGAGIGAGLARYAASLGMTVVLADIDGGAVAALRRELRDAGHEAVDAVCDVRDADALQRLADTVQRDLGPVRLLVNNAGFGIAGEHLALPLERELACIQLNVVALVELTRRLLPGMVARGRGGVINIASIGGLSVEVAIGHYNVTKAALIHLTRSLAKELAPGVRVNAICPGLVKTDMARALWESNEDSVAAHVPLRRLGEPSDIAEAAVFLASDRASWITGTTMVVDGGMLL